MTKDEVEIQKCFFEKVRHSLLQVVQTCFLKQKFTKSLWGISMTRQRIFS